MRGILSFNRNSYFQDLLLRFYEQIVSGFWIVMLLMYVEQSVYRAISLPYTSGYFSVRYVVFCAFCTTIFMLVSIALPKIRVLQLRRQVCKLLVTRRIGSDQKNKIKSIWEESLICKGFFTKEGFGQFIMTSLFNCAMISAYYSFENALPIISGESAISTIPVFVFTSICVLCMLLSWYLDIKLSGYISLKRGNREEPPHSKLKRTMMIAVLKLLSRDSFQDNVNNAILEDTVDEVCLILEMGAYSEPITISEKLVHHVG